MKKVLKYSLSGIISFIVDYIFYVIFNIILNPFISNVLARIISCNVNYYLNKNYVFKSKKKNTLIKYYLLVIIMLIINTSLLYVFNKIFNIDKYIAKIIVEAIVLIINYLIQSKKLFK